MDLQKLILEATTYQRVQDNAFVKRIHVSQIAQDAYYLAMKYVYGTRPPMEISDLTLGTLFHEGALNLITRHLEANGVPYASEFPLSYQIGEWTLSGYPDLVLFPADDQAIIYDLKLVSSFSLKKYLENPEAHQYTYQLNWYRYMLSLEMEEETQIDMKILFFVKNVSSSFSDVDQVYNEVDVPIIDDADLLNHAREKIAQIEAIVNGTSLIGRCDDLYERNGEPVRCQKYCNYNYVCPFYQQWLAVRQK